MSHDAPPVFHDPGGRRWPRLRRGLYALAALAALVLAIFAVSVVTHPFLPRLQLPQTRGLPRSTDVRPPLAPPKPPELPPRVQRTVDELRRAKQLHHARPGKRPQQMK